MLDAIPGISYAFAQPIDLRVQEMIIGARGDVVVKVFGDDIATLNRVARDVAAHDPQDSRRDRRVHAAQCRPEIFHREGRPRHAPAGSASTPPKSRTRCASGSTAKQLGIVLEGAVRTPLFIRGEERLRASAGRSGAGADRAAERRHRRTVAGRRHPVEDGPIQIIREGGQRFATVLVNVRGRDLVGFVADAKAAVERRRQAARRLSRSTWGGQFENQQRAAARLAIVLPIALGADLPAALPDVRLAAAGDPGVLQRAVRHHRRHHRAVGVGRVPVGAGLGRLHRADRHRRAERRRDDFLHQRCRRSRARRQFREAVMEGARRRLRPVMLTATIAALGLTPFLFASGPGSEIQKPLAIVVIGGLVTATLLTLILLPILYDRFGLPARRAPQGRGLHRQQGGHRGGGGGSGCRADGAGAGGGVGRSQAILFREVLLRALDHRLRRLVDVGHDALHLLAGGGVEVGLDLLRLGEEFRVLHGGVEGAAQQRRLVGGRPGGATKGRAMAETPVRKATSCLSSSLVSRSSEQRRVDLGLFSSPICARMIDLLLRQPVGLGGLQRGIGQAAAPMRLAALHREESFPGCRDSRSPA